MSLEMKSLQKIRYEISQIKKEYDVISILKNKLKITDLDSIELRAAAIALQSIYTGFEKILIIILKDEDYPIPNNHSWHSDLLLLCKENRFISNELESKLREFMGFRHFVRHAYSFMLDSDRLKPLLNNSSDLLDLFVQELIKY